MNFLRSNFFYHIVLVSKITQFKKLSFFLKKKGKLFFNLTRLSINQIIGKKIILLT